jgi:hypothetical protein
MNAARRHRRQLQHLGGVVSVAPIRDRTGADEDSYSICWHSPGGDLRWLSPRIPSQEGAEIAAAVLSDFVRGAKW